MYRIALLTLASFVIMATSQLSFKQQQLEYSRVREAYKEKEQGAKNLIKAQGVTMDQLQLYVRAFKKNKELELWGKNKADQQFKLIKTYKVCRLSGELGPKRKEGDLQIPEGYYHINRFNPYSNFYLSLGLNYPNKSDKILGVQEKLGGDIFIHGACVTIGCLPITDAEIKELYLFCIEAKNNGQNTIPVTIFPTRLNEQAYKSLQAQHKGMEDKLELWEDLKAGYDLFNEYKQLPSVSFLEDGRHKLSL